MVRTMKTEAIGIRPEQKTVKNQDPLSPTMIYEDGAYETLSSGSEIYDKKSLHLCVWLASSS